MEKMLQKIKSNAEKFFVDKNVKVKELKNERIKVTVGISEFVGTILAIEHLMSFYKNKGRTKMLLTAVSCGYVKVKCVIK